jgi:hypothetical protein
VLSIYKPNFFLPCKQINPKGKSAAFYQYYAPGINTKCHICPAHYFFHEIAESGKAWQKKGKSAAKYFKSSDFYGTWVSILNVLAVHAASIELDSQVD